MEIKTSVVKTYWIGMTPEQKKDLTSGLVIAIKNSEETDYAQDLNDEQLEALNALRVVLLNN